VSRRRLSIILALGVVAYIVGARYGPAATQERGMAEARETIDRVRPTVSADPRFSRVEMHVLTNPQLRVHGDVPDAAALDDLKRIVVAPRGAHFLVGFNGVRVRSGDGPAGPSTTTSQ
jgi:hypothetical protein